MGLKKTFIVISLIALITVTGVLVAKKKPQSIQNISVQEFDSILASRDPFIVDVHTPEQIHIPGTDAFIDFTQVKDRLAEFPQDKKTEILVYCRSGSMSLTVSQDLIDAGYTNVKNLVGGINAWHEAHLEVSLNPETKDLGTVIYGDIATTEFNLTNNTNQPLTITKLSTSCSCTQAQTDKDTLEPYESTSIKVSFNPAVHQDDHDLGDITRTIFIETDNLNFAKLKATITAKVIK